jgi:hypothetical protein
VETGLASCERKCLSSFSNVTRYGNAATAVEGSKDRSTEKAQQGQLHTSETWRPISLLSTLGKLLEAVVAERISFAVETYGLLPANDFGAIKLGSAEQALSLLQERIYTAWRGRKVLSLVNFDVKGAYNGVYKDRLLQRLAARGILSQVVNWVDVFCSGRTATVVVNDQASEVSELEQAGLP